LGAGGAFNGLREATHFRFISGFDDTDKIVHISPGFRQLRAILGKKDLYGKSGQDE